MIREASPRRYRVPPGAIGSFPAYDGMISRCWISGPCTHEIAYLQQRSGCEQGRVGNCADGPRMKRGEEGTGTRHAPPRFALGHTDEEGPGRLAPELGLGVAAGAEPAEPLLL